MNTTASFSIGNYSSNSSRDDHALDVTFLCDFGSWQEEVGWSIVDANGVVVASGIAPDEQTDRISRRNLHCPCHRFLW